MFPGSFLVHPGSNYKLLLIKKGSCCPDTNSFLIKWWDWLELGSGLGYCICYGYQTCPYRPWTDNTNILFEHAFKLKMILPIVMEASTGLCTLWKKEPPGAGLVPGRDGGWRNLKFLKIKMQDLRLLKFKNCWHILSYYIMASNNFKCCRIS